MNKDNWTEYHPNMVHPTHGSGFYPALLMAENIALMYWNGDKLKWEISYDLENEKITHFVDFKIPHPIINVKTKNDDCQKCKHSSMSHNNHLCNECICAGARINFDKKNIEHKKTEVILKCKCGNYPKFETVDDGVMLKCTNCTRVSLASVYQDEVIKDWNFQIVRITKLDELEELAKNNGYNIVFVSVKTDVK